MRRLPFCMLLAVLALLPGAPWLAFAQAGKTLVVKPSTGPLAGQELYANSHALLIGISKYQHLPADRRLQFADKDALALREVLIRSYGFAAENVTLLLNEKATKAAIERAMSRFANAQRVGREDRLLVFFSGHGQTVKLPIEGDMGFLIPHDAEVDLNAPENAGPYLETCVEMEGLWKYLRGCPAKHALVLADACFSGLLVQPKALAGLPKLNANELAKQAGRPARQVLTAGGKGEEALEDASLGHGAFTFKLLEELRAEARVSGEVFTATDLAAMLKRSVSNLTDGKQSPQFGSYRTEGEFLFVTTPAQTVPAPSDAGPEPQRIVARPADLPVPPIGARQAGAESKNTRDGATMVWVPAGEFGMGSEDGDADAAPNEKPVHRVRLSQGFWIYKHEVTVGQYRRFCAATGLTMPEAPPWGWHDADPVVNVNWHAADAYGKWAGGRLPTEAEWEYTARGSRESKYPWGNAAPAARLAVFAPPGSATRPRSADSLPDGKSWCGALHMAGNVWEWCNDWYAADYYRVSPTADPHGPAAGNSKVLRGGSWFNDASFLRAAMRNADEPGDWDRVSGFRAVRSE